MHWVDRGPEPAGLKRIHCIYTPLWIQYYPARVGKKPTDSYWRSFREELENVFRGLCAYCEEATSGEVEHFQPKSKFPHLVYTWDNWLFACHECNHSKLDYWPASGYVDPCSNSKSDRPEDCFVFDIQTGLIMPNRDLTPSSHKKARKPSKILGSTIYTTEKKESSG